MTNFARNFFKVPLTGLWLQQHVLIKKPLMTFNSRFGETNGIWGPNEAADFWYQWFPSGTDIYVDEEDISNGNVPLYIEAIVSCRLPVPNDLNTSLSSTRKLIATEGKERAIRLTACVIVLTSLLCDLRNFLRAGTF